MLKLTRNGNLGVIVPVNGKDRLLKFSGKQRLLIELLKASRGDVTGYELVQMAPEALAVPTIYVHLDRLETKGVIRSKREIEPGSRRLPKRYVRLNEGVRVVDEATVLKGEHEKSCEGEVLMPL